MEMLQDLNDVLPEPKQKFTEIKLIELTLHVICNCNVDNT